MSKKILSIVLALALALSCFAVSAFAAGSIAYESEEDAALYNQAWALESTNSGNVYTVKVLLTANYDVGPIQFKVLKTVNKGTITLTNAVAGDAIPAEWTADVSFSDTTGKVAVIPNPEEEGAYGIANPTAACVAVLTYTVSDGAAGSLVIDVADAKNAAKPNGTLIAARMDDKNVVTSTAYTGQTVSQNTNTVTIGSAAPTLVAIDGTLGVVDTSRTVLDEDDIDGDGDLQEVAGYLLGFDPDNNASIDELFAVEGDGTMEIVASSEGSEAATGTMVNVVDNGGNVVATYVVIVFGDVDGSGSADPTDASQIEQHDAWMLGDYGRLFSYQAFAGDVFVDGAADPTDASNIEQHDAWMLGDLGRIDVAGILTELGF